VRRGTSAFVVVLGAALVVSLVGAASAGASFHLIKLREMFPGTVAHPDSDYIELQMYVAGQTLVDNGDLRVFNADGSAHTDYTPTSTVGAGESQRTVLIGDSDFGSVFPGITPDFTDSALNLSSSAGAACWPITELPIDCVSWGAFTGAASLPSPGDSSPFQGTGTSGAIGDGMAIRRSIATGCPTFLEDSDDTNNGAADFSEVAPNPRPNSASILETSCGGG
jgi:hypothetical protein